jgi:hypothetical protein
MINLNDKIPGAHNFKYNEFIKSDTATKLDIINLPNDEQWRNIELLAVNVLQPVRNMFGSIKITSGFRSRELNIAVGGNRYSNHCLGEAADIKPVNNNIKLLDIITFIDDKLCYRNMIAEYLLEGGWIHVDYRQGANIKMLKVKDYYHNYDIVTVKDLRQLYG